MDNVASPNSKFDTYAHARWSTWSLDVMIPFKRIVLFSLIAPAVIVGPMFVLAMLSWALMNPISDGDAPFRLAGLGILAAVPLYAIIALLCIVIACLLQRFGVLSRRSLLVVSAGAAFSIAGYFSLRWLSFGDSLKAVQSFIFFFGACFFAAASLSLVWWWLASNSNFDADALRRSN